MRFLLLIGLMGLFILPEPCLAKKKKRRKKRRQPKVEQVQQQEQQEEYDDSSYGARGRQKIGVGLLYTPLSDFVLSYGLTGFYNLSSDLQLGFDFLTGSEDLSGSFTDDGVVTVTKADLSGLAFWAYGRYFIGNSFNVMGGLGYRSADASFRIESVNSDEFLTNDIAISSLVAPIAIGNHWSFDSGFTIGVDWLAYMVALTGSAESTTSTNIASGTNQDIDSLNDDAVALGDRLAKTSTFTLLLTTIGFQF